MERMGVVDMARRLTDVWDSLEDVQSWMFAVGAPTDCIDRMDDAMSIVDRCADTLEDMARDGSGDR